MANLFANIFKCMKIYELRSHWSFFQPINNIPALVQTPALFRSGNKPLSEQVMATFTDIYTNLVLNQLNKSCIICIEKSKILKATKMIFFHVWSYIMSSVEIFTGTFCHAWCSSLHILQPIGMVTSDGLYRDQIRIERTYSVLMVPIKYYQQHTSLIPFVPQEGSTAACCPERTSMP